MPGALLSAASTLMCAHGGRGQAVSANARVRVSGSPVLVLGNPIVISGCPVPPSQGPPCAIAQAVAASVRVRATGQPVLTAGSALLATPSGAPVTVVNPGQTRVTGA